MQFGWRSLRLILFVVLCWGIPNNAKAVWAREPLTNRDLEKLGPTEQQDSLSAVGVLSIKQTLEKKHNDAAYDDTGRGAYQVVSEVYDEKILSQTELKAEADRLFQVGMDAFRISRYRMALDSWQAALEKYVEIGDRQGGAHSLGNLGLVYDSLGDYQRAIDFYQQALAIAQEIGDRQGEANSLGNLGIAYRSLSDYQRAIGFHQQALAIQQEIGDRQGGAHSLGNLGIAYHRLGDYQRAIGFHQQYLAIQQEIGDRQGEANSLSNLGNAYSSLSDYQQAINFHQQALTIAREIGNRQGEANSSVNLGNAYSSLSDYQQAINFHQQALDIAREIGDRQGEANSSVNLGNAYSSLSDYQQAINFHQQALDIVREIGDRQGEAGSLGNLGLVYDSLGDYQQAINFHQQALDIAREIGDRQGEAASLGNLGIAYYRLGNYQRAINFQQQALVINQEIGDREGNAVPLDNLGSTYYSLGDYQRAVDFYQQSLVIDREIGDRQGEATSLGNLGVVYDSLGDYQRAIDFQQQSLAIDREIGDRQGESASLGNLGIVYKHLGNYQRAIDFQQQSLAIDREIGDRQGEAASLGNLGIAYKHLGNYQRAIDFQQQSLDIKREIGDRQGETNSLGNLGIAYLRQQDAISAEKPLTEAVAIYESLRSPDLDDGDRISFFETQANTYRHLELAFVLQDKVKAALEVSESGRSRSFVQLLSEKLSSNLEEALSQSPDFEAMQRIAQEQNSVLVEYSLVQNIHKESNDWSLYIWLIQPTGELHFKEVPLADNLKTLTDVVSENRKAMGARGRRGFVPAESVSDAEETTKTLRKLHQLLIEPIADLLPTDPAQQIVFIPKGDLFLVPFPALKNEAGTYLIEQHTIRTAPSIQVLDLTHQQAHSTTSHSTPSTDLLAVGNPVMPEIWLPDKDVTSQLSPLPGAEAEAQAIADLFETDALLGAQATEQAVKKRISDAQIVHLATHGLLEYGTPEESGIRDVPGAIALTPSESEDGFLTAAEILQLTLQADLVVLSACDTGLGTVTSDGVIGLSRSLIVAGTPSVIVSLWSIPDSPTVGLMTEFYNQRQQGKDKAQALRQAMLITMKAHPDPVDWAAFTLIGEAN